MSVLDGGWLDSAKTFLRHKSLNFLRFLFPMTHVKISQLDRRDWHDRDMIMFHAIFQVLVDYVELEVGAPQHYNSTVWDFIKFYFLPRSYTERDCRIRAIRVLTNQLDPEIIGHDVDPDFIAETLKMISLYKWYKDQVPILEDPFKNMTTPKNQFIDADGNPTNEMFSSVISTKFGRSLTMNKMHPDYVKFLSDANDLKEAQDKLIEENISSLVSLRGSLWT